MRSSRVSIAEVAAVSLTLDFTDGADDEEEEEGW
jgi:hypothetical protein